MNTNAVSRDPDQTDLGRLFDILEARTKAIKETKHISEASFRAWLIIQIRDICEKLGLIFEKVIGFFSDIKFAAKEGWQAGRAKARTRRNYRKG